MEAIVGTEMIFHSREEILNNLVDIEAKGIRMLELDAAPGWVRFKIGRMPFMSIWSAVTLITSAGMLYTTITTPAVGGFMGLGIWVTTIGLFVLGGIVYAISRWYRQKKEGVDISLASKEIPPV
jgi:hypothetical protein